MTEIFRDYLLHPLLHSLKHNLYILPVLFIVYLLIEFLEHRAMDKMKSVLSSRHLGLFGGAALGLFPQCGFSVAAANLYSEHLISAGVMAAVFIATSDEALPLLISNTVGFKWLLPTMAVKFFFAVLVGAVVNLVFKITKLDKCRSEVLHHHHSEHTHEGGEHHHCESCDSGRGIVTTALWRTLSIFLFLLVTSFFLNMAMELIGEERLGRFLLSDSIFQPFLTSLIGLIPNCAASVITTNLFMSGTVGFGALISGLSVGSGVGALVLFRVNKNIKQNLAIMGILYLMSSIFGLIITVVI